MEAAAQPGTSALLFSRRVACSPDHPGGSPGSKWVILGALGIDAGVVSSGLVWVVVVVSTLCCLRCVSGFFSGLRNASRRLVLLPVARSKIWSGVRG